MCININMVNIKTIAKLADVSPSTVSRVLSGKNKKTNSNTERIYEIAEKLGYKKNLLAKGVRTGKSYTVGVIITDISFSFYPEIIKGMEDTLSERNYALILKNTREDSEREKNAIHNLVERQVEGIIIAPIIENVNEDYFWELKKKNIPFVVIDRYYPYINCDFVGVDDRHGAYIAIKYLIELGHRNIGIVTGPLKTYTGKERFEGYKDAFLEFGIKFNPEYVKEGIYGNYEEVIKIGMQKTKELIEKSPEITAIFYGTDILAIGGLKYLKEKGIKIPEEISIIGFADLIEARLSEPELTTVRQPKYEIGKISAEMILKKIEMKEGLNNRDEKKKIFLKTELVIRNSVAKPKKKNKRR